MANEGDEWRKKWEKSEDNLQKLKKLAHKAVTDYEDLQRKYDQNQKQYEEMKNRLTEREETIQRLEELLEPALAEHDELKTKYEIAIGIREEAEKYATQIHKENAKLKHQSQFLLQKLSTTEISLDELEAVGNAGPNSDASTSDLQQIDHLKQVISSLESEVAVAKVAAKKHESDLATARAKEEQMMFLYKHEVERSQRYMTQMQEYDKRQAQFESLSEEVLAEYKQLKARYETEKAKTDAAAKYASQMYAENHATKRQSAAILSSAESDKRLMEALRNIEKLSVELESASYNHQREKKQLEEMLASVQAVETVDSLQSDLDKAQEEIDELRRQASDNNALLRQVQAENEELSKRLKEAELKLLPPAPPAPPPLPPPGGFFKPLRTLLNMKSKDKVSPSPAAAAKQPKFPVKTDETMSAAINEMMDRIKRGDALRPVDGRKQSAPTLLRRPSQQDDKEEPEAIQQMESILGRMKRSQASPIGAKAGTPGLPSGDDDNDESELSRAFRKMSRKNINTDVSGSASAASAAPGGGSKPWNLSQIYEAEEKD